METKEEQRNYKEHIEASGLRRFTDEQQKVLNQPITKLELIKAIREQKGKKSPGPDGISAEYYQLCEEIIIGPFLIYYCKYPRECKFQTHGQNQT